MKIPPARTPLTNSQMKRDMVMKRDMFMIVKKLSDIDISGALVDNQNRKSSAGTRHSELLSGVAEGDQKVLVNFVLPSLEANTKPTGKTLRVNEKPCSSEKKK